MWRLPVKGIRFPAIWYSILLLFVGLLANLLVGLLVDILVGILIVRRLFICFDSLLPGVTLHRLMQLIPDQMYFSQ